MKKLIITFFILLIVASAIFINGDFVVDTTEDDIFGDSFTIFLQILFNVFILVPEIDWFYNVLYFVYGKKKKYKTVMNILAGVSTIGILVSFLFFDMFFKQAEISIMLFLGLYILIRIIYVIINLTKSKRTE